MASSKKDKYKYFRIESSELFENLTRDFLKLRNEPNNTEIVKALFRYAHTLKGAASVVGIDAISQLFHKMEDWLSDYLDGKMIPEEQAIIFMLQIVDISRTILKRMIQGEVFRPIDVSMLLDVIEKAHKEGEYGTLSDATDSEELDKAEEVGNNAISVNKTEVKEQRSREHQSFTSEALTSEALTSDTFASEYLKISLSELDEMARYSNEMIINTLRLRNTIDKIRGLQKQICSQRDENSPAKVLQMQSTLDSVLDELELGVEQSGLFSQELNDTIMDLRLVTVEQAGFLFEKVVYTMASQYNKNLSYNLEGGAMEVDRTLLENIKEPLCHILRNAVIHGVESPDERKEKGKSEEATITLSVTKDDNQIKITCEDDGRGLDPEVIKEKAMQKGLLSVTNAADISDEEAINYIFYPGFSTSETLSEFAGRGVGLEVVKDSVLQLDGNLTVESDLGIYTRFILTLPFSISMTDAFMVEVAEQKLLFPFRDIVGIREIDEMDISYEAGKMVVPFDGLPIAVAPLAQILSITQNNPIHNKKKRVVVFKNKSTHFGLFMDRFLGARKILLKKPEGELQNISHVKSLTILETGDPAFVIDINGLFDNLDYLGGITLESESEQHAKKVLVVDDSLTTRAMLKDILEDEGLEPTLTCSAEDALISLKNDTFDLIITDIEMPGMDGFELCRIIRDNAESKNTPLVIMSSMGGEADISKGSDVGANAYIVKGSFNYENFLRTIRTYLG